MRRSCCSQSGRASRARDDCVTTHGTCQQDQQWRIQQLIDSCINIILPSRIPAILFRFIASERTLQQNNRNHGRWSVFSYFILFYCQWASRFGFTA